MRFHKACAAAAVLTALVTPLGGGIAGAVTSTSLTIVDAFQYSSDNLINHTICVDGNVVHTGPQPITSGIATTPGTHAIVVNSGATDCSNGAGSVTGTVDLLDTAAQTLVINWPAWVNQEDVLTTSLFADDLSCTPADTGRVVFRNVATNEGFVGTFGTDNGSVKTPLISNIARGAEGSASVPAGAFPGPGSSVAGWYSGSEAPLSSSFTMLSIPAGSVSTVYAIGGNDGATGMFEVTRSGTVCDVVTTTTTTTVIPTTTTTTTTTTLAPPGAGARVATPVAAQPRYTG